MIAATNTHTHIHARAHKHRMRPCRGFPRSMEGRKETRFEVVPLYADILVRGAHAPEGERRRGEGRGGALHRARDERTNETRGGRRGERGKRRRRASFRTVLEKVVAYTPHLLTYITLVSPPPSTPTIGRHKLSRYNAAHGTDGRTAGRPAGRPLLPRHRCDPLSDTPPPSHLPQPRPCVSFARRNYVTVARTSRPKFSFSARTWIVR